MICVVDLSILAAMAASRHANGDRCKVTASKLTPRVICRTALNLDASMQGMRCVHKAAVPCVEADSGLLLDCVLWIDGLATDSSDLVCSIQSTV